MTTITGRHVHIPSMHDAPVPVNGAVRVAVCCGCGQRIKRYRRHGVSVGVWVTLSQTIKQALGVKD